MATRFSYPLPIGSGQVRWQSFFTKYSPTEVDWSFKLNTSVTDTYAGQVVQLLSINIDSLTIKGRFGQGGVDDLRNMTRYFQTYFSVASQGIETVTEYSQLPMTLSYDGALDVPVDMQKNEVWTVYPVEFPSYKRSLDNFAPEWQITCQVYESPASVETQTMDDAILRLRAGTHEAPWQPDNVFSDPSVTTTNTDPNTGYSNILKQAVELQKKANPEAYSNYIGNYLPQYNADDLQAIANAGASSPIKFYKSLD